ncbi:class I SAM-dependent methyltransferase [Tropicibacter sp. R15_0]|uniref:class I SAM-dependent methyltransferase n=1 Tax=Tropicibacter sp. R15_0 TaxID=2821101 RepID=UPI001ADC8CC8|nr:class I SAM-dependent methyltransferase [Tropicibacter sp. R15_0]MBO9467889.1 class I SAM-dependent methyltransferase [Tropicibacter sp. R15_0]
MHVSAQSAPSPQPETLMPGPPDVPSPEIAAFLDRPNHAPARQAFLQSLSQIDPAAPRSDALTQALILALSAPNLDMRPAQEFVQHTLFYEVSADDAQTRVSLPPSTVSLITAFLYHRCNDSLNLEPALIDLRAGLLGFAQTGAAPGQDQIALAEALARHSFTNEYIWDVTETEQAQIDQLTQALSQTIESGGNVSAFALFLVGAYQPLDTIPALRNWVLGLARQDVKAVPDTLRLMVLDRLIEDDIAIDTLTPIQSETSAKVRAQYEENPYPRWRHLPTPTPCDSVETYVAAMLDQPPVSTANTSFNPKVLIAGAGTGQHPIFVAQNLPTAAVLAVDLSRASLAYGIREAAMRDVKNIAFGQGDILQLTGVEQEFDLIESMGVLHHMQDPEQGLQALVKALKPGGYLRLGLYSETARRAVTAARLRFAKGAYGDDLASIRQFRRDLIDAQEEHAVPLWAFNDFYKTSEFRDLAMHVQEHQFTLPALKSLLKRNGLTFLGFSNPSATAALTKMPASRAKRRRRDFQAWERFEKRNPDAFANMYQFFCVKN